LLWFNNHKHGGDMRAGVLNMCTLTASFHTAGKYCWVKLIICLRIRMKIPKQPFMTKPRMSSSLTGLEGFSIFMASQTTTLEIVKGGTILLLHHTFETLPFLHYTIFCQSSTTAFFFFFLYISISKHWRVWHNCSTFRLFLCSANAVMVQILLVFFIWVTCMLLC
jgi:hypothetical protein